MVTRIEKDVAIVGSGGAGLSAALFAARAGLDVLLVEKESHLGGTLAWSGGGVWMPLSPQAAQAGFVDTRDDVLDYLRDIGEGTFDEDVIEAFVDTAPEVMKAIAEITDLQMYAVPGMGDWITNARGARPEGGRTLLPAAYDGSSLGVDFQRLRHPLGVFNAPGGFMVDLTDIPHLDAIRRSPKSAWRMARLYLQFLMDRRHHGRGARLSMGNAVAAALLKAALREGAEMWTSAPATDLVITDGAVRGVVVTRNGEQVEIAVRRGVLLCSGGFSANAEMRRKYIPFADQHHSLMSSANNGDGIRMGQAAGGKFIENGFQHGGWVMISLVPQKVGAALRFPHLVADRPKPGCIAVNAAGERFVNEASLDPISAMHASGSLPAWLICDRRFIRKYGLGAVRPGGLGLRRLIRSGYLVEAPTLEDLAIRLGIDPAGLATTVTRNNRFAAIGEDLDFGKGSSPGDRNLGDPSNKPNPNLGPIGTGPFYGLQVFPGDSTTMLGLKVDRDARVIDHEGKPLPGLYAAGLDMNSIFRGRSPGGGANNGPAIVFGYRAAQAMARGANRTSADTD